MATGSLKISYTWEGDYLSLWNDLRGPVKARDVVSGTILTSFHSMSGECRGLDLFDAAQILLPYLNLEVSEGTLYHGELSASYRRETDTLLLVSSKETVATDQEVADGLVAHCNEKGWAVGFTLERAAELLLPHLETWRPWTEDETAQIRKQMANREAAMQAHEASSS